MSAITAKASRKMKKYAVLTREPRCFLGSFDLSWEQRKLEDYLTVSAEKNTGNIYGRSDVLSVSGDYGIVNQIEFQGRSFAGASVSNYGVVQTGDVVYTKSPLNSNPYGIIKTNKGKPGIVSTLYAVYHPKENAFSDFIQVYFEQHARMNNYMHPLVNKGAKNDMKVSAENALKGPVCFPSRIEQESISAFFSVLDNLITLHQRKCALLFSPFQSFISMMFTTSTFSWEQRKFEEIAVRSSVICSDDTLPRVEYEDIVSGTGRLNKDIYAKQSSKSGIVFHQGDVLYGKLRPYLQNWLLPTFDGLAVGDFWVLQPQNADSSFLYRLIQSRQFDEVANQSTGTKMPRADWKLVSKTVFSIPSNISEQAAIGTYFTALDSLITLHQRKCIFFTGRAGRLISTVNKKRITSSWEQRKFSELVQIERGGSPRPIDDFITDAPNGLNWVKIGDAPTQGNYITKTAEKIRPEGLSKTREVHPGDLILSNSMSFGKPYIMGIDGCIHDGWLLIRNTYGVFDLTFLCHLLGTPQMLSQYRSLAAGSTVNNLNKELVGNTYVTIPSITEQRVLGAYLEQLDNLITLHQRKPFLMKWRTSDANRNQTNRLVL